MPLELREIRCRTMAMPLELREVQDHGHASRAQGGAGHADSRARLCTVVQGDIYPYLPCVSRVRCNWCHAIQIKLGGSPLPSWDARLEGCQPHPCLPELSLGVLGCQEPPQVQFLPTNLPSLTSFSQTCCKTMGPAKLNLYRKAG